MIEFFILTIFSLLCILDSARVPCITFQTCLFITSPRLRLYGVYLNLRILSLSGIVVLGLSNGTLYGNGYSYSWVINIGSIVFISIIIEDLPHIGLYLVTVGILFFGILYIFRDFIVNSRSNNLECIKSDRRFIVFIQITLSFSFSVFPIQLFSYINEVYPSYPWVDSCSI